MKVGDRVNTQSHGPGTVMDVETARVSWPKEVPERRARTGRYGVKLDTPHFTTELAYYWPNEINLESESK